MVRKLQISEIYFKKNYFQTFEKADCTIFTQLLVVVDFPSREEYFSLLQIFSSFSFSPTDQISFFSKYFPPFPALPQKIISLLQIFSSFSFFIFLFLKKKKIFSFSKYFPHFLSPFFLSSTKKYFSNLRSFSYFSFF